MTPWLPLYLVLLAAATLSPFQTTCGSAVIARAPQLADLVANLLLFVPLGLALRGRGFVWVGLCAIALSIALEALQLALPRNTSPFDVATNGVGALLGRVWAPKLPGLDLTRGRVTAAALTLAALALAGIASVRPTLGANDFSSWEPFALMIGSEADASRPWRGLLEELWVYDRALSPGQRPDPTDASAPAWADGGPVLWMRFQAPAAAHIDGPDGARAVPPQPPDGHPITLSPEGLVVRGGGWQLPEPVARHLYDRLRATREITVAARVRPDDLDQGGPGRVLSFSRNTGERNFTLGQRHANVVWRVRTPWAGPNGNSPAIETRDAPLSGERQMWVGSFAGVRARVEIDGQCHMEVFYPSRLRSYPLSVVAVAIVAVTALTGLGAASALRRRRRAAGLAGAAVGWGLLAALGAWSHVPGFGQTAAGLGIAALAGALPLVNRLPE